ncbi:hypothetical protein L7E55_12345 [Pelotomaculum isophthalicicum JI]|uniref:FlgN protein n=1 Tax=Pelotomaculum isophthalicicum JI TaxID=947010 RepID=A0A9X4H6B5_9FIRM|nr:hypothetical protein [Pelotomaculum isophthalicicum]MDF9409137.1 hypothetical protein [Pelotomaculum isophthalicicum JI]
MHNTDSGGHLPANIRKAIDEKLALLGQIASMAAEQALLAGSLAEPEKSADFDRLLDKRQQCIDQIDAIDKLVNDKNIIPFQEYEEELIPRMKTILEQIQNLDKKTYTTIFNEMIVLKNQLGDLSRRKKSLTVYSTNILARKSMIVDKSR